MLKRIITVVILSTMIIFFSLVAQSAHALPFTDTAIRPRLIEKDTVIITTNHGMWVSTDPVHYSYCCEVVTENVYVYQDGSTIMMSFLSSGVAVSVIKMPDPAPIVTTANKPRLIEKDTVIITTNHGMWVSTDPVHYSYCCEVVTENVCIYQYRSTTIMSFLSSGVAVSVIEMPDPAPIVTTTNRPANMYPGTILFLSNGQVVKVLEGNYGNSSADTEGVILYLSTNTYFLSFETLGFSMPVEILTDTTTNYLLKISIVGTGEVYGYGINCGSNCSEVLKAGTYIELTGNIPPNRWYGCNSSSETTCYLTMDSNKNITANFSSPISLPSLFLLLLK